MMKERKWLILSIVMMAVATALMAVRWGRILM